MKKEILFIFFFLFIFSSQLSFGEVYKWVDEKGVIHFTDDITQVPEKFRPQIETIGASEEIGETKGEKRDSSTKKKEDTYLNRSARGEGYWRGRVEEWGKKLKASQEKVNSLRIKYNELTEKFNQSKSTIERANIRKERDRVKADIDQYNAQIEEAKYMLEKKIPEEAEVFKAKPEWLKQ